MRLDNGESGAARLLADATGRGAMPARAMAGVVAGLVSVAIDAVDGAHSTASMCERVVALKRTTMRGAVHGRG